MAAVNRNSDVVSDDGSWSDVYDESKPAVTGVEQANAGEYEPIVQAASAAAAEQPEAVTAAANSSNEQDNDVTMVDHRSETREEQNTGVLTMNDEAIRSAIDEVHHNIAQSTTFPEQSVGATLSGPADAQEQKLNASAAPISSMPTPHEQHHTTTASADVPGFDNAEVAFDSSPYQSSSDDDSDTSSDDSDDSDEIVLLTAQQKAEMEQRFADEDEDVGTSTEDKSYRPRTQNEGEERVPARPDIVITDSMPMKPLGVIIGVVEGSIVIRGVRSGAVEVLEPGSLAVTEDRKVISVIVETFGRVEEPMYTIMLGSEHDKLVAELNLAVNTRVMYSTEHSTLALTRVLQDEKGTDASNIHDEEVAIDDQDFSDDEQEMEYRKVRNRNKKDGKTVSRSQWLQKRRDDEVANEKWTDFGLASRRNGSDFDGGRQNARNIAPTRAPRYAPESRPRGNIDMPDYSTRAPATLDYDGDDSAPAAPQGQYQDYNVLTRPTGYSTSAWASQTAATAPAAPAASAAPAQARLPPWQQRGRGRGSRGRGTGPRRDGHQSRPQSSSQNYPQSQPQNYAQQAAPYAMPPQQSMHTQQTTHGMPYDQQMHAQVANWQMQYQMPASQWPQQQQHAGYQQAPYMFTAGAPAPQMGSSQDAFHQWLAAQQQYQQAQYQQQNGGQGPK